MDSLSESNGTRENWSLTEKNRRPIHTFWKLTIQFSFHLTSIFFFTKFPFFRFIFQMAKIRSNSRPASSLVTIFSGREKIQICTFSDFLLQRSQHFKRKILSGILWVYNGQIFVTEKITISIFSQSRLINEYSKSKFCIKI